MCGLTVTAGPKIWWMLTLFSFVFDFRAGQAVAITDSVGRPSTDQPTQARLINNTSTFCPFTADDRVYITWDAQYTCIKNHRSYSLGVWLVSDVRAGSMDLCTSNCKVAPSTTRNKFPLAAQKNIHFPNALHMNYFPQTKLKVTTVQDLIVCAALTEAFSTADGSVVFAVDSDTSHLFAEYSISYWLGLCGIEARVVHTYQNRNEYHLGNPMHSYSDSYCTVRSISGLTVPNRDKSAIDGFNCLPTATGCIKPTCLEDFMNYQVISSLCSRHSGERYAGYDECMDSAAGAWNHSAADDSSDTCNIATSCAYNSSTLSHGRLHFFTSWGLMQLVDSVRQAGTGTTVGHYTEAYSAYNSMVHGELLGVLRAFAGSEYATSLVVHSLSTSRTSSVSISEASTRKQVTPYSRLLMKLLLVYDTDEAPVAALNIALQALQARITADLDSASYTQTVSDAVLRAAPLLDALMLLFGTDFKKFHNTCRNSADGVVSQNYICRHRSARQQLADVILSAAARTEKYFATCVGRFKCRPIETLCALLPQFATEIVSVEDYHAFKPALSVMGAQRSDFVSSALAPSINVLVDGDTHVLMFVQPEHVDLVQKLVYHWQRHSAGITNFLFIKYLIIPTSGTDTGGTGDFYTRKPTLGAVLGVVAEKVAQVCSVKDVVYVLVGLQAVLAFPQPGRLKPTEEAHLQALCREGQLQRDTLSCDATAQQRHHSAGGRHHSKCSLCGRAPTVQDACAYIQGVVPSVEYGGSATYKLDANIVFAAATSASDHDHASNQEEGEWMDVNTFVGVGYKVLDMINEVRNDPRYSLSGQGSSAEGSGPQQSLSPVPVSVEQLLREHAARHPADVTVDCQQRAFHSTKSARLIGLLSLGAHSTDAHFGLGINVPGQNADWNGKANDTVAEILELLVVDSPTLSPRGVAAPLYAQYKPNMGILIDSYLQEDTAAMVEVAHNLQYAGHIMPYVYSDKLPYLYNMRRDAVEGDGAVVNATCFIDFRTAQFMTAHIFTELYLPSKILSSCLTLIGALYQLILCDSDNTAQAFDDLVYIFIRIGSMARYVNFIIPPLEYPLSVALLEVYEQRLLTLFADTSALTPDAAVAGDTASTPVDGSTNLYTHNSDQPDVFTSDVRARYSVLPEVYKDQILTAVKYALSGMKQELGVYPDMVAQMERSLGASPYQLVKQRRALWHTQRQALATALLSQQHNSSTTETIETTVLTGTTEQLTAVQASDTANHNMGPRTHYVTYASEHTEGLQNLLDSAALAGIHIEVLGLGQPYRDYSSKTDAYLNYLINGTTTVSTDTRTGTSSSTVTGVPEDDVVLLMDAYDVLVFPSIQRAASVLAQAPSPLLFCAERGIYPEYTASHFYQRGAQDSQTPFTNTTNSHFEPYKVYDSVAADGTATTIHSSAFSQKFLNSGCVLGRAGQMMDMLRYTQKHGRTFRDDQLMLVRYMLQHPDLVSIDTGNKIFATNFKMSSAPLDVELQFDLRLRQVNADIGLLHCNNIGSGSSYGAMLHAMRAFDKLYYRGNDGPLLLQAVWAITRHKYRSALEILHSPVVFANCTSRGGGNPLRIHLLKRIEAQS